MAEQGANSLVLTNAAGSVNRNYAVGMITVLESIQTRALGLRVVGFSCLTNWAAGMQENLNHEKVLETGKGAARVMAGLLKEDISSNSGGN
jgi:purine-nucleoside phosphorylase